MTDDDAEELFDSKQNLFAQKAMPIEAITAFVGLIIAETYSYLPKTESVTQLPVIAVERTFSYVIGRSICIGNVTRGSISHLLDRWAKARDYAGYSVSPSDAQILTQVWSTLLAAVSSNEIIDQRTSNEVDRRVAAFCKELMHAGAPSKSAWRELIGSFDELAAVLDVFERNREERVVAFENAIRKLNGSPSNDLHRASAIAGYLASRISPGTLEHIELVRSVAGNLPSALLWYSAFAGLERSSNLVLENSGTARRLFREVTRSASVFDAPTCDIGLDELEVLSRLGNVENLIPVLRSGYVEVEIAPNVNTVVRNSRKDRKQDELFPTQSSQIEFVIPRIERALAELYEVYERLRPQRGEAVQLTEIPDKNKGRRQRR